MPMWRCPHCGTPQAETARCWVCHRSSTACATCRHFRLSVAAQLGYCGLDRQRTPLRGDEIRACWEAGAAAAEAGSTTGARPPIVRADDPDDRTPVRRLEFVEVRSTPVEARSAPARHASGAAGQASRSGDGGRRRSGRRHPEPGRAGGSPRCRPGACGATPRREARSPLARGSRAEGDVEHHVLSSRAARPPSPYRPVRTGRARRRADAPRR